MIRLCRRTEQAASGRAATFAGCLPVRPSASPGRSSPRHGDGQWLSTTWKALSTRNHGSPMFPWGELNLEDAGGLFVPVAVRDVHPLRGTDVGRYA